MQSKSGTRRSTSFIRFRYQASFYSATKKRYGRLLASILKSLSNGISKIGSGKIRIVHHGEISIQEGTRSLKGSVFHSFFRRKIDLSVLLPDFSFHLLKGCNQEFVIFGNIIGVADGKAILRVIRKTDSFPIFEVTPWPKILHSRFRSYSSVLPLFLCSPERKSGDHNRNHP